MILKVSISEMQIITVAVIAYNSEKTIKDTLDSISNQTFNKKNIEVIISDDCSIDNTLYIAEEWRRLHLEQFHSVRIVSHDKNQGVTANCNQAWRLATGSWIKSIAADDLLLPDCIELNVNYVLEHPSANVVFSNMIPFTQFGQEKAVKHDTRKFFCGQKKQYESLLRECDLFAPTSFMRKDALVNVGFGDQSYPMIEDYPLWLKYLSSGYQFDYLNEETVLYRRGDSLSQQEKQIGNIKYLQSLYSFQREKIWPRLPACLFLKKWDDSVLFYQRICWIKLFGNQVNIYYAIFQKLLFLIRPYRVFSLMCKMVVR